MVFRRQSRRQDQGGKPWFANRASRNACACRARRQVVSWKPPRWFHEAARRSCRPCRYHRRASSCRPCSAMESDAFLGYQLGERVSLLAHANQREESVLPQPRPTGGTAREGRKPAETETPSDVRVIRPLRALPYENGHPCLGRGYEQPRRERRVRLPSRPTARTRTCGGGSR